MPLGTTDLGAAWVELRRLQRQAADREAGIVGESHDLLSRPLAALLGEWCDVLTAKGTSAKQVALVRVRLTRLFAAAGWTKWGSVTKDSLLTGLAALRREGLSHQTSNHYRTHAKGFAAWLADGAGVRDPLVRVGGKLSVEVDRRHPRRSPDDVEMCRLFDHLDSPRARLRRGMTGPQRALGYRVAMATGLRAGELRSLTRESFDLEAGTVAVEAAYSKHRRRDVVQLPAWLVVELRAWFGAGGGCWVAIPERFPGRLLRDDLRLAGVPVETPAGYFDMHSLRHYYCTMLANQAGISPKTLMVLCRHSTPQLSLNIYAKARLQDLKDAVDQLPSPGGKPEEKGKTDKENKGRTG